MLLMKIAAPSGSNGLNSRSRLIARSVGSLHSAPDRNDSFSSGIALSQTYTFGARTGRSLAKTIDSLKKASNSDLSRFGVDERAECIFGTENDAAEPSSSLAFATRNQKGKGAVQKRVERYQPRSRISRETTSGESDSNSSEVNGSPLLRAGGILGQQQFTTRRYLSSVNGSNRSVSCIETMPRPGVLQTRRVFEQQQQQQLLQQQQQRHSLSNTPRRVPSYLAQKLAGFVFLLDFLLRLLEAHLLLSLFW
ncbi:unnamed protein product [Gongylonema pulchrum]|uniref:Uncharacterized protein n=1 Tax=Gongylonema pulchrum TaxID=637853 RepID=A0A183DRE5_9BILA|nr:unnamed protein product [Gongylonema pulchrum]